MSRQRDSQRSKVYASEIYIQRMEGAPTTWDAMMEFHRGVCLGPAGGRIETAFGLEEASLYDLGLWKGGGSNANASRIRLGPARRGNFRTYLHELAHSVLARIEIHHTKDIAWSCRPARWAAHGPEWVGVLLHLVLMFHGEESRRELSVAFRKGGVKIRHWGDLEQDLQRGQKK